MSGLEVTQINIYEDTPEMGDAYFIDPRMLVNGVAVQGSGILLPDQRVCIVTATVGDTLGAAGPDGNPIEPGVIIAVMAVAEGGAVKFQTERAGFVKGFVPVSLIFSEMFHVDPEKVQAKFSSMVANYRKGTLKLVE